MTSSPRTWHDARTAIALVATVGLLAACGAADDGLAVDPAPGGGADEPATPVDLRACPSGDAPVEYEPPPEEQPEPDPALTTAGFEPDLPVSDDEGEGTSAEPAPDVADAPERGIEPIAAAQQWASTEVPEHFGGVWLDHDHGATVIAFTDDVDRYADEVRERFGEGWWVVEAAYSEAELREVQQQVLPLLDHDDGTPPGTVVGTDIRIDRQVVTVSVVGGDDASLAELVAELDHPAICFGVLDPPPTYDPDGPVRTLAMVAGWRAGLDHPGYALLEVAHDQEAGERAFADNVPDGLPVADGNPTEDGLHARLETVDWDREVIVVWSAGRSGSCPEWVDDIEVQDGAVRVSAPSPSQGACTEDYNPYRAVLAVDRDRVPAAEDLPMPFDRDTPEGSEAVAYPD